MMSFALSTLWFERQRYFSAVLAIAFSTVLICIQFGLLMGMFALTSVPIDFSNADIWMSGPGVVSVDVGKPIPKSYVNRLETQPEIQTTETLSVGFQYWTKADGGAELCIIVGSSLGDNSLGAVSQLTPELRSLLTEPMAVVIDESDKDKLGVKEVGEIAQIADQKVRLVGMVRGLGSLQGAYIFCSLDTAKKLIFLKEEQTIYVLGRCQDKKDVDTVVNRLKKYEHHAMSVKTAHAFSYQSRMHWLTKTKAGLAMGFSCLLGVLVGAVVTRQSLYSATIASIREYAVLRAMGIPRWRMAWNLVAISFWVGLAGVLLSLPIVFLTMQLAGYLYLPLEMPWWLLVGSIVITWTVAIFAGLTTLHSLLHIEPMVLLR
jgi:putative ABC transport system permease protein